MNNTTKLLIVAGLGVGAYFYVNRRDTGNGAWKPPPSMVPDTGGGGHYHNTQEFKDKVRSAQATQAASYAAYMRAQNAS